LSLGTKVGTRDKYKRVLSLSIEMDICTTYETNHSLYYIFYKFCIFVPYGKGVESTII
jgi:hypothetical protein